MESLWSVIGLLLCLVTLPGTLELALLTLGGVMPRRSQTPLTSGLQPLNICVVIPAHNEEKSIGGCVASLFDCETAGHSISVVVIADNCTDATAGQSRLAGARVLERHDENKRGKGYALDYAFSLLLPENYDAFLIVDADTGVEANFI